MNRTQIIGRAPVVSRVARAGNQHRAVTHAACHAPGHEGVPQALRGGHRRNVLFRRIAAVRDTYFFRQRRRLVDGQRLGQTESTRFLLRLADAARLFAGRARREEFQRAAERGLGHGLIDLPRRPAALVPTNGLSQPRRVGGPDNEKCQHRGRLRAGQHLETDGGRAARIDQRTQNRRLQRVMIGIVVGFAERDVARARQPFEQDLARDEPARVDVQDLADEGVVLEVRRAPLTRRGAAGHEEQEEENEAHASRRSRSPGRRPAKR